MSATLIRNTLAAFALMLVAHPADLSAQDTPGTPAPVVRVLTGNPDRAGRFVERITFAAGFHTSPHSHSVDLREKVLKGRLMLGLGAVFDTANVVAVLPGSTIVVKAARNHYDWWPEGGELQIEGEGPVKGVIVDSTGKPVTPVPQTNRVE